MTQERLTMSCCYILIYKDSTDTINLLEIAKEFVSFNDRYKLIFGSFLMFNNITQLNIGSAPPT